jgi:hypothetical protein
MLANLKEANSIQKENNMKICSSIISGIIGLVCGLIAMWFVFGVFEVPIVLTNVYIAAGIASFFGSFFGSLFAGNAKCEVKVTE